MFAAHAIAEENVIAKRFEIQAHLKKSLFDYVSYNEIPIPEEGFRQDFIISLVDQCYSLITNQFSQLSQWNRIYGFIQNSESRYERMDDVELEELFIASREKEICLNSLMKIGDQDQKEGDEFS